MSDGTAQIPASAAALVSEQLTVRDLMRLDSERALETARERRARAGSQAPRASMPDARPGGARMGTSSDAPRLVGIYGVGKRLFAEVRAGAQMFLFLRGHSLPLGHVAGEDLYRLKELAHACVRLERRGDETVLCLPAGIRP